MFAPTYSCPEVTEKGFRSAEVVNRKFGLFWRDDVTSEWRGPYNLYYLLVSVNTLSVLTLLLNVGTIGNS